MSQERWVSLTMTPWSERSLMRRQVGDFHRISWGVETQILCSQGATGTVINDYPWLTSHGLVGFHEKRDLSNKKARFKKQEDFNMTWDFAKIWREIREITRGQNQHGNVGTTTRVGPWNFLHWSMGIGVSHGKHIPDLCHIPSGKRLHNYDNYGKIHHFEWVNQLFFLGIFNRFVSLPEGIYIYNIYIYMHTNTNM